MLDYAISLPHVECDLILTCNLLNKLYYPHYTDEVTESWGKGSALCPGTTLFSDCRASQDRSLGGLISVSTLLTLPPPLVSALGLEFGNKVWSIGKERLFSVQFC